MYDLCTSLAASSTEFHRRLQHSSGPSVAFCRVYADCSTVSDAWLIVFVQYRLFTEKRRCLSKLLKSYSSRYLLAHLFCPLCK